jgi:sigma-E factor negative regulatory protein RseB
VLGSCALVAVLLVQAGQAPARDAAPGPGDTARDRGTQPAVDPAARRLLQRAAAAQSSVSYRGTQYVSAWASGRSSSHVLEVEHSPARGTTWRAPAGAGPGGHVVSSAPDAAEPSLLAAGAAALLARHYSLVVGEAGARVAGRDTDVVIARRPGAGAAAAPVARFWVDRETGLALRREVYDRSGRVVRASAFVDLSVGAVEPSAEGAVPPEDTGRAWAHTLDDEGVDRLRRRGWACPLSLPGPLPLVDARRGGHDRAIVHLSYADGIASVSVFQQRGSLDPDRLDGYRRATIGGHGVWQRDEVPRTVVWASGGTVFTLVGDAPERTVDRAVDALHDGAPAGGGIMERLGRGLDRVGSWFNPAG